MPRTSTPMHPQPHHNKAAQHCIMILWGIVCNSHDNRPGDAQHPGNHTLLMSHTCRSECLDLMRR